ncbi:MAG: alpha amylase C-terminal domain-containing protein [Clostridiales Family XIII bacterium]|jgi:1,4-alpha-glucan branching enzyme|nr:alpha amylase C-terminal domain-containing protein [Clostridiales Family XIII bacterium]
MDNNVSDARERSGGRLAILDIDPYLKPYAVDLNLRMRNYERMKARLLGDDHASLSSYANGHLYFGFHRERGGWVYREWAPNAEAVRLCGDFNGWNRLSHPLKGKGEGVWELFVEGEPPHGSKVRVVIDAGGEVFERIPLYAKRVVQNPESLAFDGQIWLPPQEFRWTDGGFRRDGAASLLIYEAHVGMAGEKEGVSSYKEFKDFMLPRVEELGYNAIQLMAIMEHPYYGSFGYQVSNFFAASSRFGEPEDLKALIDDAHGRGIVVLLDLVHSHAARNEVEGLARFDGTVYQFFHSGARGEHPQWGSKLFNYGSPGVVHFLLSNLKFWLEEYHFDGFRFDGVTSMLYMDHALGGVFDNYKKYFSMNTDAEAVAYLQLATELCKETRPDCLLIAEDMSGMPGMCLPIRDGGLGFDYRLGMGVPDFWIKYLKERRDEDWHMGTLWHELTQRRPKEKVVGYCESHDQALVGDKTIMFWLADQEMYWHMSKDSQSPAIDRAMALHKMIRLVTCTCAGEGYLNFMGNEFGHPEWIDFPRPGNGNSYRYARRQWSLAANGLLRYSCLEDFDKAMTRLVGENRLNWEPSRLVLCHEDGKALVYRKGDFVFCFNFHPVEDFTVSVPAPDETWEMVLHSSWPEFGGYRPHDCVFLKDEDGCKLASIDRRSAMVFRASQRAGGGAGV